MLALVAARPEASLRTAHFVVASLIAVGPLVVPGVLISAWVTASGAGGHIASAFEGHAARTILAASAIGAITPVCGITVLPLMTGLLAAGMPLAPIMAFWLSSPVTDPAMFATTAATLGWKFAFGKSLAAFGLGLFGGAATAAIASPAWTHSPLRQNWFIPGADAGKCREAQHFQAAIWKTSSRRTQFKRELYSISRMLLICLVPAFTAEYLLNGLLQPQALAGLLGDDNSWGIPLAVFIGAPAYLDGYAALPLTRALMDHGMSAGAAMAFLVSGSVVSIWGAMAIFPALRLRPFLLYLALAVSGSLAAGWLYSLIA